MEAIGGILLVCFGFGWIILSFHYAIEYWHEYNWAWGILIFIICIVVSPYIFIFLRKLIQGV